MATALPMHPPDRSQALNDVAIGYIPPQSSAQDFYSRRLTLSDIDFNKDSSKLASPSTPSTSTALPLSNSSTASPLPRQDAPMTEPSASSTWLDYPSHNINASFHPTPSGWLAQKFTDEPHELDNFGQSQTLSQQHQRLSSADPLITQHHSASQSSDPTLQFNQPPSSPSNPYHLQDSHNPKPPHQPSLPNNSTTTDITATPSSPQSPGRTLIMGQRPSGSPPQQLQQDPSSSSSARDFISSNNTSRPLPIPILPSSPRHPSIPLGAASRSSPPSALPPIVPLSAGPSFNPASMVSIPISPNPRAYAQQPTYINPSSTKPSYAPPQVPKEEVCVECAMRDQDMADVDVTSPGIWERESDALYEDLLRREEEEELAGLPPAESASRPKARGGLLTEANLRLWLSVNPKEPSSRQQTLDQYVKAQRTLLEAEALAHARAMRESRMLDDKMRDTYSQLRRSAYELGSSAQPADEFGGVRIKPPHSPAVPSHLGNTTSHKDGTGREVTLLENGMIVEHVDVRKEEREERERKRREERREKSRARKSSRSSRSGADVMSVYSLQTPLHPTDSGFFSGQQQQQQGQGQPRPDSRYSQSMSARPSSVWTTGDGQGRPTMLRAQSQASFSDMQSLGEASSPRRSRFFGFKNLSASWRSQESFAPSGSMIDMHVALQREHDMQYPQAQLPQQPAVDIGSNAPTLRIGETWPAMGPNADQAAGLQAQPPTEDSRSTKKAKGFKKIWRIVTGGGSSSKSSANDANGRNRSKSLERLGNTAPLLSPGPGNEDDQPLAPPPPLSYLVGRESGGMSSGGGGMGMMAQGRRHVSTPSLPSTASNAFSTYAPSPPTAPSSLVPSPTSSRPGDKDGLVGVPHVNTLNATGNLSSSPPNQGQNEGFRLTSGHIGMDMDERIPSGDSQPEDIRGRTTRSSSRTLSSFNGPVTPGTSPSQQTRPGSTVLRRDKSLPPLPPESSSVEFPNSPSEMMLNNNSLRPESGNMRQDIRPQTVFTYAPMTMNPDVPSGNGNGLMPPKAAFRTAEARRQSFGGVGSGPHPAVRSLPARGAMARGQLNVPPFLAEEYQQQGKAGGPNNSGYAEFGVRGGLGMGMWEARGSQRSLQIPVVGAGVGGQGAESHLRPQAQQQQLQQGAKKRKSKFGLASLFGKKSANHGIADATHSSQPQQQQPQLLLQSQSQQQQQSQQAPTSPYLVNAHALPLGATMTDSEAEYTAYRSSHSHSVYDATNMSGYASPSPMSVGSGSFPSHTNQGQGMRQSVASHRNIDLVDQDRDFFAYRYPSTDQRLDLVR